MIKVVLPLIFMLCVIPLSSAYAEFYVLGDNLEISGFVPERLMDDNYQIPVEIDISNDKHTWDIRVTPGKYLEYETVIGLTSAVGFTDGKYTISTTYGDLHEVSNFSIGELYYEPSYEFTEPPPEPECIFTAHIDKTWVYYNERPKVFGTVINCDSNEYHEKNRLFVKVLDIDGNLLDDGWKPNKQTVRTAVGTQYSFIEEVYRKGGGMGANANVEQSEVIHILPDNYFFYMPQINSLDFNHRGAYEIQLKYGDHVESIWFAVLDRFIPYYLDELPEKDICIDSKEKLVSMNNTLTSMYKDMFRHELNKKFEKAENQQFIIDDWENRINTLRECTN